MNRVIIAGAILFFHMLSRGAVSSMAANVFAPFGSEADFKAKHIVVSDDFDDKPYTEYWTRDSLNPTGTVKQFRGRLETAVDPKPTALLFESKKIYYIKSTTMSLDVTFKDEDAELFGPMFGLKNEHLFLGYQWRANGEVMMMNGDFIMNPRKRIVSRWAKPAIGKTHRLTLFFKDGVAGFKIDGKTVHRQRTDFNVLPPVRINFVVQNYDEAWRHLDIERFGADMHTYAPEIKKAADGGIYSEGVRERKVVRGLSVRAFYSAVMLYVLFFAAFTMTLGAFRTRARFLKKPLLFAGGLFLAVFLVEAGFQIAFPRGYVASKFRKIAFKHDEDNFNRRDVMETTAPDGAQIWFYDDINRRIESAGKHHSIVFIGDSITYGIGVKEARWRFSDIIAADLKRKGHDTVVLNLASPGYSTRNERYVMELFAGPLNLKTLFVGLFYDDLMNYKYIDGYLWNRHFVRIDNNITLETIPAPRKLNNILFHTSSLYQWFAYSSMIRMESLKDVNSGRKAEWERNLLALKRFCDMKGAELVLLTMPIHRPESDPEKGGTIMFLPLKWRYNEVEKYAADHGIKTLRVSSLLGGMRYSHVSSDMFCHYNRTGNKIIAAGLLKYMDENRLNFRNVSP